MIEKITKLKFDQKKTFPPSAVEKVKQFNEEIKWFKIKAKFKEDAKILDFLYAEAKIAVDDPFFSIKGYKITIPKQEKDGKEEKQEEKKEEKGECKEIVTIEHTPGQVLFVDFWATWCQPCQETMQHNQKMLEKHKEDWGNKVRIVAASLDYEESEVIERAQKTKWLDVEHIILNEVEFEEIPRIYQVRQIPFIVIVNKQGKIKYLGHPSQAKAEEFIQKLLDEEEAKEEEKKEENEEKQEKGIISKEQFAKLVALQKEYLAIFREKLKNEKFKPTVLLKFTEQIKYDLEGKIVGEPIYIARKLMLKMYETQYNKFKEFSEFVEKIDKIVKKEDFKVEFTLELEKSIDIEFGKECDNCKKELAPTAKQYYCHFHKLYFCYECGNKIDYTKKGNSKYLHPCNMVYINVINDSGMKNTNLEKIFNMKAMNKFIHIIAMDAVEVVWKDIFAQRYDYIMALIQLCLQLPTWAHETGWIR